MTEIFVDQSIGTATGSGTIGDPYGTLDYALSLFTRTGNEDVIHVKGSSTRATPLAFPTSGTGRLLISGYSVAAYDGGMAAIEWTAAVQCWDQTVWNVVQNVTYSFLNLTIVAGGRLSIGQGTNFFRCNLYGDGVCGGFQVPFFKQCAIEWDLEETYGFYLWGCYFRPPVSVYSFYLSAYPVYCYSSRIHIRNTGGTQLFTLAGANWLIMESCSVLKDGTAANLVNAASKYNLRLVNSVFQNCGPNVTGSVKNSMTIGCYVNGHTITETKAVLYEATQLLSGAGFGSDFVPSAELAALTTHEGYTPGAVQAASGGGGSAGFAKSRMVN